MSADTTHLFLNPTAGRGRTGRRQPRILELLREQGDSVEYHASRAPGDMETRILNLVTRGARRIVVAGGDGSIHEASNGILRAGGGAALGVIPSGTGNDFAKACDIPLDWEHASRLLADRLSADQRPRKIDVGQLNERFFVNGAGIGFDAKVTRIAKSIQLPLGDLVYLLAIFKTMMDGIATPHLQILADDYSWEGPLTLAAISNGPWIGGMFRIAPMASNADGKLELLIAKPVTRRRILRLLPKLMKGSHLNETDIEHRSVTQLKIHSTSPLPSHLDGEVQALQTDFNITVKSNALSLL